MPNRREYSHDSINSGNGNLYGTGYELRSCKTWFPIGSESDLGTKSMANGCTVQSYTLILHRTYPDRKSSVTLYGARHLHFN